MSDDLTDKLEALDKAVSSYNQTGWVGAQLARTKALADAAQEVVNAYRAKQLVVADGGEGVDGCQLCLGAKGGVPGNENRVGSVIACDYCTSTLLPNLAAEQSQAATIAALEAENERILGGSRDNKLHFDVLKQDYDALEASNERLQKLLNGRDYFIVENELWDAFVDSARATLKGSTDV